MPTKNLFKKKFFCLLLFDGTFTSFFKDKKPKRSHKAVGIKVFLIIFCLGIEGSGSIPLTNESGSRRPKNIRIRRQRFSFALIFSIGNSIALVNVKPLTMGYVDLLECVFQGNGERHRSPNHRCQCFWEFQVQYTVYCHLLLHCCTGAKPYLCNAARVHTYIQFRISTIP